MHAIEQRTQHSLRFVNPRTVLTFCAPFRTHSLSHTLTQTHPPTYSYLNGIKTFASCCRSFAVSARQLYDFVRAIIMFCCERIGHTTADYRNISIAVCHKSTNSSIVSNKLTFELRKVNNWSIVL